LSDTSDAGPASDPCPRRRDYFHLDMPDCSKQKPRSQSPRRWLADSQPPLMMGLAMCSAVFVISLLMTATIAALMQPSFGAARLAREEPRMERDERRAPAARRLHSEVVGIPLDNDKPKVVTLRLDSSDSSDLHAKATAARYVVPARTSWSHFLSGVKERLQLSRVSRIVDSLGEEIMEISDLIDRDDLTVRG